ncbi:MAG: class II histone deacetylase [Anaerolineaceae bacterium]|nr:class II histone deacetylase [Anaerolineaceae bacterium]
MKQGEILTTGFVFHESFLWHDLGSAAAYIPAGGYVEPDFHIDNPSAKRRLRNLVEVSGLLQKLICIQPRMATIDELSLIHKKKYIRLVKSLSNSGGGDAGQNAIVGRGSFEIASLAVGGCIEAVKSVIEKKVDNAYALVRPAGHHAEPDMGRGYCIFANIAIAIKFAKMKYGINRIAVVDWDVHHGNGTQKAFYSDPSVLTISIHQDHLFPQDMGGIHEIGEGQGKGFNINIPFPPGSGSGAYSAAFSRVILPALELFKPEIIFVACGFDANAIDPLGRQLLYSQDFRQFTKCLKEIAAKICQKRLILCQEGGYSTAYVPFCGLAVIEELADENTGVNDPFLSARHGVFPYKDLQPIQDELIKEIENNLHYLK